MRIFFFTSTDPNLQGDLFENMILRGLRNVFGNNVIDYPRKQILYDDIDTTNLHGKGFSIFTYPIKDIENRFDPHQINEDDVIIYGVSDCNGLTDYLEFNKLTPRIFYLDGHDDPKIRKTPCFKREYFQQADKVFPSGFGIPTHCIRPIPSLVGLKTQLYQQTTPPYCFIEDTKLRYMSNRGKYQFDNQDDYYDDMQKSWFGLTCPKGGWDTLRHYEIMAAGSLLIFKKYGEKPALCSPINLPCVSYNNMLELKEILFTLINNGKPTKLYLEILFAQREWLIKYGTCEARALNILQIINKYPFKEAEYC